MAKLTYLCFPMRGYPFFNGKALVDAAIRAKFHGLSVVSPLELDQVAGMNAFALPETYDWSKIPEDWLPIDVIMSRDLRELAKCDSIALGEGWQKSEGCAIEIRKAIELGLEFLDARDFSPLRSWQSQDKIHFIHKDDNGPSGMDWIDLTPLAEPSNILKVSAGGAKDNGTARGRQSCHACGASGGRPHKAYCEIAKRCPGTPIESAAKEDAKASVRTFSTGSVSDKRDGEELSILEEAYGLTRGDRNSAYGHPSVDHGRIAEYWSVYLGTKIRADQVAVMMVLLKVRRLGHSPAHKDSLVDIAGYADCCYRIVSEAKESKP